MRIIAGKYKGLRLLPLDGSKIRPTSDRLKESLFSIITSNKYKINIDNSNVLDICSGTGSLGIEAFSRGANSVFFIDKDYRSIDLINKNIAKLKIENQFKDNIRIIRDEATNALKDINGVFEIVLIDPPYNTKIIEKCLFKLKEFDVRVINASVSGDTTSGGLNRLNWLIEGKDIDIVVLCLGANDMLRGISPILVRQNLNKILETLTEKKITVLFAGMIAQEAFGQKYKKEFDKIYPELAKKFNVSFLPFLLDGVALNPELNLKDGKHPNAEGINLISKNLEKKLINLLRN